jgi:hypothetical protein
VSKVFINWKMASSGKVLVVGLSHHGRELRVLRKVGNLLTNWAPVSFSRTVLRGVWSLPLFLFLGINTNLSFSFLEPPRVAFIPHVFLLHCRLVWLSEQFVIYRMFWTKLFYCKVIVDIHLMWLVTSFSKKNQGRRNVLQLPFT